jgi:hypothetical protein
MKVLRASGFDVQGLRLRDCRQPVSITDATGFRLACAITNRSVAPGAAIKASGQIRDAIIAPMVRGDGQRFSEGIALAGGTFERLECQLSGIAPGALASPTRRLTVDGRPVTTARFAQDCLAWGTGLPGA